MRHDDKRLLRKLKREVKRAGSRRLRHKLKRELEENPEEAPYSEMNFGKLSSAPLNALDDDATRRKKDR
jgi:hypothetical protein